MLDPWFNPTYKNPSGKEPAGVEGLLGVEGTPAEPLPVGVPGAGDEEEPLPLALPEVELPELLPVPDDPADGATGFVAPGFEV